MKSGVSCIFQLEADVKDVCLSGANVLFQVLDGALLLLSSVLVLSLASVSKLLDGKTVVLILQLLELLLEAVDLTGTDGESRFGHSLTGSASSGAGCCCCFHCPILVVIQK